MSEELLAYCMKCKVNRPIKDGKAIFTKSAQPATRGICPECGTGVYRMGYTEAHAGMERPEPVEKPKKKKEKEKKEKEQSGRRKGKLVIVESPAKARTIENYLGKAYKVRASVGHVRDLLKSRLSVDIENDFEPSYRVPNDKRDIVKELKSAAAKAEEIYLATDPDREGEAIAWHLIAAAEIDEERVQRVIFHEITRDAIQEAFANPHHLDMNRVNAQQARRILDRLVGYELSPLLWKKVRPRLSAGRVQSVAVRLIVEREREIDAFVPEEYWTIDAELARNAENKLPNRQTFIARLFKINGEDVSLPDQAAVDPILAELEAAEYLVEEVKRGTRKRNPAAPYITSTLQQSASRRLGFSASKTMRIAQQLYEGVNVGDEGQTGLITYMRTDSTHIADQALKEVRAFIQQEYGKDYLPDTPNAYTTKAKGAQEAHEAIRPTSTNRTPDALKSHLSKDQFKLYRLIWQRFVACQMSPAVYDTIRVDVKAGQPGLPLAQKPYLFRATGAILRFPGFLAVFADAPDEDNPEDEDLGRIFPEMSENDLLDLLRLLPVQHFTQPPVRYSEATLVRALEENGIGRPSTYAPILNTIQQRGYALQENKRLLPTETGIVVNDLLVAHFPDIVDLSFTARMEDNLDEIASGEQEWVPVLRDFYDPFKEELDWAFENVPNVELGDEEAGRDCPNCGKPLIIRWGRFGKFIGCSDFPTCRHTEPWLEKVGALCPNCGGDLIERKTRKGRTFYGCASYPECEWTSWKLPLPHPCPACKGLLIVQSKKWAQCYNCEEQVRLDSLPAIEKSEQSA